MGTDGYERITVLAQTDEQPPRTLVTIEGQLPQIDVVRGNNPETALYTLGKTALGQHFYVHRAHSYSPNGRMFITKPVHPDITPNVGYQWTETNVS